MEQLRIAKRNIYEIEVNDRGETIQFDMEDIELPFKCQEAMEEVAKIQSNLKAKLLLIQKKEDRKKKNSVYSDNQLAMLKLYKETFAAMRAAMDKFLGAGACQKIFGDRNYLEMYDDLFEQLEPHLKKMELTADGIRKRIESKYGSNSGDAI